MRECKAVAAAAAEAAAAAAAAAETTKPTGNPASQLTNGPGLCREGASHPVRDALPSRSYIYGFPGGRIGDPGTIARFFHIGRMRAYARVSLSPPPSSPPAYVLFFIKK